jgi:dTDP-4-dehydrorhamnose reductase
MKKILITGASGMLGAALVSMWDKEFEIYATGNSSFSANQAKRYLVFDLGQKSYKDLISFVQPDYIVHCAAITNSEFCEKNSEKAFNINGESVRKLLKAFPKSKLIFISTDKVLSPNIHLATEKDIMKPLSVYGKSKALGEKYILESSSQSLIVRTIIVGKNCNSNKKNSLAEWIVYSLLQKQQITLFTDVIFNPISIWHFAEELKWIIKHDAGLFNNQVVHIAGSDIISKYDFGYQLSKQLKLETDLINKGSIDNSKLAINSLKDITLDSTKYHSLSGRNLPRSEETISLLVKNFIH